MSRSRLNLQDRSAQAAKQNPVADFANTGTLTHQRHAINELWHPEECGELSDPPLNDVPSTWRHCILIVSNIHGGTTAHPMRTLPHVDSGMRSGWSLVPMLADRHQPAGTEDPPHAADR